MTEPNWMPYENGVPGLDAGLDDGHCLKCGNPDGEPHALNCGYFVDDLLAQDEVPPARDHLLPVAVEQVPVAPLTVVDEYEAITDPAFTEARFAPGGDLEYVQEEHRDLFRQPLLGGSRWECVTRARSVNSERARLGKLEAEGHVVVRQRTATYTAWSVVPEEEWLDAEVPL